MSKTKKECCEKHKKKGEYCKNCPKLEEAIKVEKKKKPIIVKKKRIVKQSSHEGKISRLKTIAHLFLVKKRYTKEKKFKWIVVFTIHQPSIRGEIPAVYLRKRFKKGKTNTVWGPVKRIILTEGERISIDKLPETHIQFLLKEIEFIK